MKGLIKLKFTPEVIAALQTLKDAAENDFERHRINVLERDLTAPPVVEVIDDKHLRFDGAIYRENNCGHHQTTHQLHRAIWTYHKGDIPLGDYEVHHIDGNKSNNDISNLQLLTKTEHLKAHNLTPRI